jgi:asparagine synthase (glutamine-hydrolysing)
MCGICGIYHFRQDRPANPATVRGMARAIAHRGPDDEGFHFDGALGLGFRRLSIIDLEGGHQPMSDADETVWVVFNGEIYNFENLRRKLEERGHRFRTRSDTEVIVHGYKEWGSGVLQRLRGMFGLAIWDTRSRKLLVARDSSGIKLIYYRVDDVALSFGSEMRAVLATLPQRPAVDPVAINLFLRYRYTPSPMTIYDGVRKLAPGTMLVASQDGVTVERWHVPDRPQQNTGLSDDEATEELFSIYKRALKRHLIADVPVGLLLSGGIDSGLLLGMMNLNGNAWPTYTVGYGKSTYKDDELADAEETARLFGSRHTSVDLSRDIFERALPCIVSVLEEPIAAASIVPMFYVCERARQDVKVALVGQGPDELFAGYTRHLGVRYGAYWRRLPGRLRRVLAASVDRLPRNEALKRGAHSLDADDRLERYRDVFSLMSGREVEGLFRDGVLPVGAGDRIIDFWEGLRPELEGADELGGFQTLEIRSSLPDELMMYADKLSMAHGLEVRVPYLDNEVVDFAQSLPSSLKVRFGQRKWVHRRVCERFLPPAIMARKKRGFAVNAVDDWFDCTLNSRLSSYLLDGSSLMFEFLKPQAVYRLLEEHRSNRRDNHKTLFSLVVLEQWLRARDSEQRSMTFADAGQLAGSDTAVSPI